LVYASFKAAVSSALDLLLTHEPDNAGEDSPLYVGESGPLGEFEMEGIVDKSMVSFDFDMFLGGGGAIMIIKITMEYWVFNALSMNNSL